MADDTQPNLKQKAKDQNAVYSNTQTANVLATADNKDSGSKQYQQLRQALDDNTKTVHQLRQAIADYASKLRQQGKISKEAQVAVHMQMNDEQLQKKISQFSDQSIFLNIQGNSEQINKVQKGIAGLIKQAKSGNKDAQKLLKSLNSADFKKFKNADKLFEDLSKKAKDAGLNIQQLSKATLKGCTIFDNYGNSVNSASKSTQNYAEAIYGAISNTKLFTQENKKTWQALAASGGALLTVGQSLIKFHQEIDNTIKKIIQFKRQSQFSSAANSDILPGGVKQLQEIRTSMNLTRQQTVQFAQGLSKLRGTTHSINDLTAAMQGMKDTIGKIDTKQLQNLTSLMQKVPKEQLDALTKGTGSSEDAAAGVLNIVNSGQQQQFLQAGASGAFGKQYAQNMGVKIDQNDRAYTQNTAMVARVTESVQNLAHNATNFFTKALPFIGGIAVGSKMLGKVAGGAGVAKGIIGGIKQFIGKKTKSPGLDKLADAAQNIVGDKNSGKNLAQNKSGKNNSIVASGVQGQLNAIRQLVSAILNRLNGQKQQKPNDRKRNNRKRNNKQNNQQNKQQNTNNKQNKQTQQSSVKGKRKRTKQEQLDIKRRWNQRGLKRNKAEFKQKFGKAKKTFNDSRAGKLFNKGKERASSYFKSGKNFVTKNINRAKDFAKSGIGKAKDFIAPRLSKAGNYARGLGNRASGFISNGLKTIKGSKAFGKVSSIISKGMKLAKGAGGLAKSGGKVAGGYLTKAFQGLSKGTTSVIKSFSGLGTKALPILGKALGAVGAAAMAAYAGFQSFKQGLKDASDAAQFFGHEDKGTSTGQDVQNFVTGFLGGNMIQSVVDMFRDKDQVEKQRIVNAQAGVSNTALGTNTAGGAILGASIGLAVGGPIGAAIGASVGAITGAIVDGYNQIQKFVKRNEIAAIQKTYDIMKAAKDQQEKNARQHQVMMQHSIKMASQNKKILQAINDGQFSILQTTKANQALFKNQKQNQLVSGISTQQYSQNNKIAVEQSGAAFSKDIAKLQQQRTKIQNDPNIQGQVKLKLSNDIMQSQIKMRKKYNDQLLQATDLANIPTIIQNELVKRVNSASADIGSTGMYGSSQGIIDDLGDNLSRTFGNLNAQFVKMGQNSQHFKKMKQDQQRRQQQVRDTSFKAAFGGINSSVNVTDNINTVKNILNDIKGMDIGGLTTVTKAGNLRNDEIINAFNMSDDEIKKSQETDRNVMGTSIATSSIPVLGTYHQAAATYRNTTTKTKSDVNAKFDKQFNKIINSIKAGNIADAVKELQNAQRVLNLIGTQEAKVKAQQLANLKLQLQAQNAAAQAMGNFASSVSQFKQGTDISKTSLGKETANPQQLQQRKQFLKKAQQAGFVKKTKNKDGKQTYTVTNQQGFKDLYKKESMKALYSQTANMALNEKGSVFQKDAVDENKNIKKQYQSFLQKDQAGNIRVKKNLNEQQENSLRKYIDKNKDAYIAQNGQKSIQKMFGKQGVVKYKDQKGKERSITKDQYKKSLRETQQLIAKNKTLDKDSDDYILNQNKIKENQQLQYDVLMNQTDVTVDKEKLKKAKEAREQLGDDYQTYKKKAGSKAVNEKTWKAQKASRQRALNQTIKSEINKLNMQSGGATAGLAAIKNIKQAQRQMATPLVANAKNMQDLAKTFKDLDQDIGKLIGAIKNDPNVRRKLMQAQLKGLQKQLNAWNGKTDANGNPTVGKDNIAAYNAEMDALYQQEKVASKVAAKFEELQSLNTAGGAQAVKEVAKSFKDGISENIKVTTAKKNEKGQFVNAEGKVVTSQAEAAKVSTSFTDAIFDTASSVVGSKDDKAISGAIDKINSQYKQAQKSLSQSDEFKSLFDEKGNKVKKTKDNEALMKKYDQQIANMKAAKTVAQGLVKSGGSLKTANQQLKIQMLKIQQQRVQKFKQFVDVMSKSIQTQKMFMASIQRQSSQKKNELALMQHGSSDQLIAHMNKSIQANNKYYKDSLKQNKSNQQALREQLQLLQKTGKDSKGNVYTGDKLKQKIQQTQTALTAAQGQQASLKAQRMKKNQAIVMANVQGIQSRFAAKKQNIEIRQDRAQNVSGTTQQWFKLQNEKLNCMKQEVEYLQAQLKEADKLGLSQQAKLQIKNKLMKKSVDLQKERIGAQRNVFEKMLGSILGGLQQQGAFKGFNQASVFGVGHGINEAGMAVSQGGESKGSYSTRTLLANSPTSLMGTRGSQTGITNAVNNLGSDAGNTSTKDKPANVANGSSNSSSSNSSTTQPPTQNSGNNANNQNGNASNNQQPTKDEANAKAAAKQQADTQQQKKEKQKQAANAQLKDHQIFAKQLTILQKILQIMNGGLAVAIDKVTGQPNSNNANADTKVKGKNAIQNSRDIKGGQSVKTGLVGNAELQVPQTIKDLETNNSKQQVLQKQIQHLEEQLKSGESLGLSEGARNEINEKIKKKKDQLNKTKEQEKQLTSHLAKFTTKQQQPQQDDTNVKGKQRVTEAQYNASKDNLQRRNRDGFFGLFKNDQTKHSKRRIQLIQKKEQLDEKIKGASSIDQKKKLQAQREQVDKDLKQVTADQNADRDKVARFKQQQKDDKAQYEKATKDLQKQGDNPFTFWKDQGQTRFEQVRQSLNMQHNRIQQKIKVAKTPQERAQLQKKKADIQKRNEENNAAQKRAKEVVKQYSQHGNLDNMYRTDNNAQQPNAKNDPKRQGNITVTQQNNNQSGGFGQGSVRRIPFEDMSSDNSRGKINGYIQVQVVRRVVINSGDGNLNKQMSPLQGAGATS